MFWHLLARKRFKIKSAQIHDDVLWKGHSSGSFSVSSAYFALKNGPSWVIPNIHRIWSLTAPPRMKVFAWLTMLNTILTVDNLIIRGWSIPSICYIYVQKGKRNSASLTLSMHEFQNAIRNGVQQLLILNRGATGGSFKYVTGDKYAWKKNSEVFY